jgi:FMN phosphatase YigB (HAD superfamily)
LAKEVVDLAKSGGLKTVLATQPVFPRIATESRMKWAGLEAEDFLLYTTYENSSFSKPSVGYYLDIAKRIGVAPEECLMVGNDVTDDMSCTSVGMKVFLLDNYLINRNGEDISAYPRGSFEALADYIKAL